jgi:lipopolysaccharide export system protein LptC
MKPTLVLLFSALLVVSVASRASAQLLAAKDGPIVYGHHHLNTTNLDAQKKFFVDTLGGTLIKIGTNNTEVVKFPTVLIFFRTNQAPTGGTRGRQGFRLTASGHSSSTSASAQS